MLTASDARRFQFVTSLPIASSSDPTVAPSRLEGHRSRFMLSKMLNALRPDPRVKCESIRAALIAADCQSTSIGHVSALINGKVQPTAEEWQTITSDLGPELCARGFAALCGATVTSATERHGDALTDTAHSLRAVSDALSSIVDADRDQVRTREERVRVLGHIDAAQERLSSARADVIEWAVVQ